VRELLAATGQERRGKRVSKALRMSLRRCRLKVEPDFDSVHIDTEVTLMLGPKLGRPFKGRDVCQPKPESKPEDPLLGGPGQVEASANAHNHAEQLPVPGEETLVKMIPGQENESTSSQQSMESCLEEEDREVIVTVRKGIPALDHAPPQVRRNEAIFRALTQMNDQKLAQLIVTNGERGMVEGIFSWQSYGKAMLSGKKCEAVGDCLSNDFAEVREDKPLFDAVREVIEHGVVVVRARDGRLCGVLTQRDAATVFVDLAEPFLFLGQIENHLRDLVIRMRLSRDELLHLIDERDASRAARAMKVDDLTLGELIRALEKPEYWKRLGFNHDRSLVLQRLYHVRDIRNKVMHFDADPLPQKDKDYLADTRRILQDI
jgi:predicted transcriptional regulator